MGDFAIQERPDLSAAVLLPALAKRDVLLNVPTPRDVLATGTEEIVARAAGTFRGLVLRGYSFCHDRRQHGALNKRGAEGQGIDLGDRLRRRPARRPEVPARAAEQ